MISLAALAPYLERKLVAFSPAERFRYFVLLLQGAEYRLGRENLLQTDCSGTICWPLFCMGIRVRMTAFQLFDRLFTQHVPIADLRDYWDHVYAVFYQKAGVISHVSPIVGRGVIFDAVEPAQPAQPKALQPVMNWYLGSGYNLFFRELDWLAAREAAASVEYSWKSEADEMLKELVGGER